jgi:uncharacterized protein
MLKKILNHPNLSNSYFFPADADFSPIHWVETNGERLACYAEQAFPKNKTIICFHGNGETVEDYIDIYGQFFENLGLNYLFAAYRGYGESTGTPALESMLNDIPAIVESINKPIAEIIFFGRSVGSIYAIHAAVLYPNAAGLILESGIADVLERIVVRLEPHEIGATPKTLRSATDTYFNHSDKISKFQNPLLILHTEHDGLVGVHHAKVLYEAATCEKDMVIFPQGNHNTIFYENKELYMQTIRDFVGRL